MTLSFTRRLFPERNDHARGSNLIDKITALAQSSADLKVLLRCAADEIGRALGLERTAILLSYDGSNMRLAADYCASRIGPVQREKLRQLDADITPEPGTQVSILEIADARSDPRVRRRLAPDASRSEEAAIRSILIVPLMVDSEIVGTILLYRRSKGRSAKKDVIQAAASILSLAVHHFRSQERARGAADREALTNRLLTAIRNTVGVEEILKVAVEGVGRTLNVTRVVIYKHADSEFHKNSLFTAQAEYRSNALVPSLLKAELDLEGSPLLGRLLSGQVIEVPDTSQGDPIVRAMSVGLGVRAMALAPITYNGHTAATIAIEQFDNPRVFSKDEIKLLELVTEQTAVALYQAELYREARDAARRDALISHIIHGVNQSNRSDEILPIVTRELAEHLAVDRIVVNRFDEASGLWTTECEYSEGKASKPNRTYRPEEVDRFAGLAENDIILCDDATDDPRLDDALRAILQKEGARSFISARLEYKDGTRLVMSAIMRSSARRWTADETEVIRAAADQVGIALERAELFDMVSHGKFQWEATFDALSDGIFIFDQEGVLRRINEAAAAFEGAGMRELIGRRCCTLLQGVEGETCRVAQVIESGRPATFELVPGRLSRPVLVTISPLTNGSRSRYEGRDRSRNNGHHEAARGAVCIVRDLSELRAAEAIAREQRSFLVKLIEHANDSILAFSPEGRLIWFNEQLIALSGYTRQELEGGDYRLFVAGDQKSLATERFSRALEGHAQTFEMNVPRKCGDTRVMLITYTPIYDGGRVTSVLSIARDVTEERLARERAAQADKLRALGQLAAGVAHNFNNILAAILGHAQLIRRDCADEALIDRMEIIEQAALDGAQTVKRIQAFGSQNESVNEVVDINQLIQDSTTLTRAKWCDEAQARGVQYEVELNLQQVPPVRGSGSELREVFVNIILNALDAMPQGGRLKIATETKGAFVQSTVTDSGIGMNSEVCDHLFEPFFTTKGVMGTGLGLAVSHSIIERHRGTIDAQSSVGKGTTFTISLPTGETDDRNVTGGTVAARSAHVLVVDDDRRVREAVVGMLRMAGHHTDHAGSGREALAKLERDRFDVVLTDLSMPEMDGWAVANEVHRRWPGVKVVLITGNVAEPAIVDSNRELVSEVIFKPIRFDDLSSALNQALSN